MIHRFGLAVACSFLLLPGAGWAEEGYFDSNGVKIRYTVAGKGEPVLLIHGFSVYKEFQWDRPGITKALAKDYRVIAYDNRGHGKSGKPTDPSKYGMEMVEDAVRLLDHLKIKKAHVVGYSMGAMITAKLVVTHPDRLLSATLGGAAPQREGAQQSQFITQLAESLEQGKGLGPLVLALTPPGKPRPTNAEIEHINRTVVGDNGKALAAVLRGFKGFIVTDEQLAANKVPTLALVGGIDPFKKSVEDVKDRMANLKVVVIPDSDHMSAQTDPIFLQALKKHLEQNRQRAKKKVPAGKAG